MAAKHYGAVRGVGEGLSGQSYAIPTKTDAKKGAFERSSLVTLPLVDIERSVERFLAFARENPSLGFMVTRVGCGLAGYADEDVAPLFRIAPGNCTFATAWAPYVDIDLSEARPLRQREGSAS